MYHSHKWVSHVLDRCANMRQYADSVHKSICWASWRVVIQLTKERACVDNHDPPIGEFIFEPALEQQ